MRQFKFPFRMRTLILIVHDPLPQEQTPAIMLPLGGLLEL
jgi:hypothetical protein